MSRFVEDRDDPDHVVDSDEIDFVARTRAERALAADPLDASHRARLLEEEAAAPEISQDSPTSKRSFGWVLVFWVLGAPFAVAFRVFSMPWRRTLQARATRRADRRRAMAIERALRSAREAAVGDASALLTSGLAWLAVGESARAERAFDAAVGAAEHDPTSDLHLAAIQNRGVARARLGFPKLAALDAAERKRLGAPPRGTIGGSLREGLMMLRVGLGALAGIDDD